MTDAQRAGKGMGVYRAMAVIRYWLAYSIGAGATDAEVIEMQAAADTLAALQKEAETNRQWAESAQATVATLAAKLRAGDALADAVHDCVNRNGKTIDLIAALAAYKQAGMGGEASE